MQQSSVLFNFVRNCYQNFLSRKKGFFDKPLSIIRFQYQNVITIPGFERKES